MGFQLVAFRTLRLSIEADIKALLNHHHKTTVSELDRRFEVELLQKTIEILSESKKGERNIADTQRILILNAMVFYIREDIRSSYTKTSPNNSVLFVSLGHSLGLTDIKVGEIPGNQPNLADQRRMFGVLLQFMKEKTYIEADPDKGYLPLEQQPYLAIKDFKAADFIIKLADRLHDLDKESIKACKSRADKQSKEGNSYSLFSSIGGMFSGSKAGEDEKETSSLKA